MESGWDSDGATFRAECLQAPRTEQTWGLTVDYHRVNEDGRICPVAVIHLHCIEVSELGLSAGTFPSGNDKSFHLNTQIHESVLKTNSKGRKYTLVMTVQLPVKSLTHVQRKDRSTSEI